jgi:hypothetical protein
MFERGMEFASWGLSAKEMRGRKRKRYMKNKFHSNKIMKQKNQNGAWHASLWCAMPKNEPA